MPNKTVDLTTRHLSRNGLHLGLAVSPREMAAAVVHNGRVLVETARLAKSEAGEWVWPKQIVDRILRASGLGASTSLQSLGLASTQASEAMVERGWWDAVTDLPGSLVDEWRFRRSLRHELAELGVDAQELAPVVISLDEAWTMGQLKLMPTMGAMLKVGSSLDLQGSGLWLAEQGLWREQWRVPPEQSWNQVLARLAEHAGFVGPLALRKFLQLAEFGEAVEVEKRREVFFSQIHRHGAWELNPRLLEQSLAEILEAPARIPEAPITTREIDWAALAAAWLGDWVRLLGDHLLTAKTEGVTIVGDPQMGELIRLRLARRRKIKKVSLVLDPAMISASAVGAAILGAQSQGVFLQLQSPGSIS